MSLTPGSDLWSGRWQLETLSWRRRWRNRRLRLTFQEPPCVYLTLTHWLRVRGDRAHRRFLLFQVRVVLEAANMSPVRAAAVLLLLSCSVLVVPPCKGQGKVTWSHVHSAVTKPHSANCCFKDQPAGVRECCSVSRNELLLGNRASSFTWIRNQIIVNMVWNREKKFCESQNHKCKICRMKLLWETLE